jgi:hypothetical protein
MTDLEAIEISIATLRRKDRWRLRKRNQQAIARLMILRLKLVQRGAT